jgi:branched-chain amino acid transport system permease protein
MEYILNLGTLFLIYSMLTISLNYLVSNTGILYVGHIAFYAIGAYSTAILISTFSFSPWIALIAGVVISVILAFFIGYLTSRVSGHYLLIASLGICEIVRSILNNSRFSGGAEGMVIKNAFIKSSVLSNNNLIMLVIFTLFCLEIMFYYFLNKSFKGKIFRALRDDPILITISGYSINKIKTEALIISAFWASIAGSSFAHYSQYIDPSSFTIMDSLILLIVIIIGGTGSLKGSILGAFFLIILPATVQLIRLPSTIIAPVQQIMFGIILIIILNFKPEGIFGKVKLK